MKFFLLLTFLLPPLTASAAPLTDTRLPRRMAVAIPRGARIWASGKISPKSETFLAIYSMLGKKPVSKLEIWQKSGKKRERRVQTIALDDDLLGPIGAKPDLANTMVMADLFWLRPSSRQTPILTLHVQFGKDLNGDWEGKDIALIFPKGFQHAPFEQSFQSSNNMYDGCTVTFDSVDEAGFLQIHSETYTRTNFTDPVFTTTLFRWNGKSFQQQPATPAPETTDAKS